MNEELDLAVDMAGGDPDLAAALLSAMPLDDVAGFLSSAEDEVVAKVLAALPTEVAAACLAEIPSDRAAVWLAGIGYPAKTRIARAVPVATLNAALEKMTGSEARQLRRDLAYNPLSVGAWMSAVPGLVEDSETVGDCLHRLRRQRRPVEPVLVVVGERKRYLGLLQVSALLSASDRQAVGKLADRQVMPVDPDTALHEIAGRQEWERHLMLPVVAANRSVLGVIRLEQMKQGLVRSLHAADSGGSDLFAHLAEATLVAISGMGVLLPALGGTTGTEDDKGGDNDRIPA